MLVKGAIGKPNVQVVWQSLDFTESRMFTSDDSN